MTWWSKLLILGQEVEGLEAEGSRMCVEIYQDAYFCWQTDLQLTSIIQLLAREENLQVVNSLTDRTFFSTDAQFNTTERLDPESMAIKG